MKEARIMFFVEKDLKKSCQKKLLDENKSLSSFLRNKMTEFISKEETEEKIKEKIEEKTEEEKIKERKQEKEDFIKNFCELNNEQ